MGPTNVCPTSVERNKSDSLVLVKIFGFCSSVLLVIFFFYLVTPEANVHIVIIMRERERETVNLVHTSERDRFVSANTRSPPALKRNQTTKGNPTNFLLFFKSNSLDELANIIWVFFFGKKTRKLTSRYVHFYSCCATINK